MEETGRNRNKTCGYAKVLWLQRKMHLLCGVGYVVCGAQRTEQTLKSHPDRKMCASRRLGIRGSGRGGKGRCGVGNSCRRTRQARPGE